MQTPLGTQNNSKRIYISASPEEIAGSFLLQQTLIFAMNSNQKLKRIRVRNLAVPMAEILFSFPDTPILKDIVASPPAGTFWDDTGTVITPVNGIIVSPANSTTGYPIIEVPIELSVNGKVVLNFQTGAFAVSYIIEFEVE